MSLSESMRQSLVMVRSSLLRCQPLQRLDGISFLGAVAPLIVSRGNDSIASRLHDYSRLEHTDNVARIVLNGFLEEKNLSEADAKLVYAAALLHDVGHTPLSHSVEPYFKKRFGIDHHDMTARIILGRSTYGNEISKALEECGISPAAVVSVLDGKDSTFDGILTSPFNADTIDGISACGVYLHAYGGGMDEKTGLCRQALNRRSSVSQKELDWFWNLKNEVYAALIQTPEAVLADHICCHILEKNSDRITEAQYLVDDSTLLDAVPELAAFLKNMNIADYRNALGEVRYVKKEYLINPALPATEEGRYIHRRTETVLAAR